MKSYDDVYISAAAAAAVDFSNIVAETDFATCTFAEFSSKMADKSS
jgi:hypothetical protein